jgi:predicted RNase H-like HicB family nuclease
VAECLEISVVTQGQTLDEVTSNLKEAVELHLARRTCRRSDWRLIRPHSNVQLVLSAAHRALHRFSCAALSSPLPAQSSRPVPEGQAPP